MKTSLLRSLLLLLLLRAPGVELLLFEAADSPSPNG